MDDDRADRTISALRTGHDDLVARVGAMTTDDLTGPSAASEWTVAQVLSHLGSGAEIMLATLASALEGDAGLGDGYNQRVWDRWNAMAPGEQADGLISANEELVGRFEGLDQATKATLRIDLGFLPEPVDVATVAALRLSEFTYHSWDIRVMSDPAAALAPDALEPMLELLSMLIGFLGHADVFDGEPGDLTVRTTAPDRTFGLQLRDAVALVDTPAQPSGVLDTPAESWLRLTAGRLAPRHTPPEVRLASDTVTLHDLRRAFPGF